MDGWFNLIVIVAFVLVAIVVAYFNYLAQQKRIAELSQLATGRGWRFDHAKDHSHDERYGHFSPFASGHSRYAYNTINGALNIGDAVWPVQFGDFHYATTSTSTSGKGRVRTRTNHHYLSYLILETPYLGLPGLVIRREGFFDKVAGFFGFDDIDFESAEFSQQFAVKSNDKRFAYDVVHPRMMEFLLDGDPPTIELERGRCCLSRGERCWSTDDFEATLTWAVEFFTHWPRHVTTGVEGRESRAR